MQPIRIRISLNEYAYIHWRTEEAWLTLQEVSMRKWATLDTLVLAEAHMKVRRASSTWAYRDKTKTYSYSLPVSLAQALHSSLQGSIVTADGLSLLDKLHHAIERLSLTPTIIEFQPQ
ncbi:hypothetical protein F5984_20010 [Rudanella paleaurantiibacter]|uniref:Uncharacterized protein n=1 Tax=Rudanella paleaurantiibacter TaxID=2614655 RepID=A0A7J5TV65_9BACT|nr:hypothetical protein [Rudanella paleaurantiibacter]KAB7728041.1 hypothetical protein F5984_20010 [Rudanella paleaurantiibacter]